MSPADETGREAPVALPAVCNSSLLPESLARALTVVPLGHTAGKLRLGCRCAQDLVLLDRLQHSLPPGIEVQLQTLDDATLFKALDRCYGIDATLRELLGRYPAAADTESESAPPATELLDLLLRDAVGRQASDLHLRLRGDTVLVRLRIDGRVQTAHALPGHCAPSLLVRVKVAAGLDIAESRRPQDGQGECRVYGQPVYFRVSSMPTRYGESVVLRLFDPQAVALRLTDLQPCAHIQRQLGSLARQGRGLVIVAGPTGSGKSTTLQALVHEIDAESNNILTLEDPVEIPVPAWQQTSIDAAQALDYADAIRSALRQDPDVLLIGEIRDTDSAAMTLRAALTGHRVYASVHAHDAIGALYRLHDLGIARSDLALCVDAIVAQRLHGRVCSVCGGDDPACTHCAGRGTAGRVAIMEILRFDDALREALRQSDAASSLHAVARRSGFVDMFSHGSRLCEQGVVHPDELAQLPGAARRHGPAAFARIS